MAVRLFLRRHRRGLAFVCGALGVILAVAAIRQPPPQWSALVAARDLPAGHVVTDSDLARVFLTVSARPRSALTDTSDVVGQRLAGPIDAGEVIVDRRLIGDGLLSGSPPNHVALTVKVDDIAEVAFIRPGDVVDVLAAARTTDTDGSTAPAQIVAEAVSVLAVPSAPASPQDGLFQSPGVSLGADTTPSILVAVPSATASDIAGAAVNSRLSVVLRDGGLTQSP
jgi:pilus assembly protein CpaB